MLGIDESVTDLLFVYGTLRKGGRQHALLARGADFVGHAQFQGRLYRVASYPGAVPSHEPRDIVHGEVYRLRDSSRLIAELDRYEGFDPCDPSALFVRRLAATILSDGTTMDAWIYLYTGPTRPLARIESGDFFIG